MDGVGISVLLGKNKAENINFDQRMLRSIFEPKRDEVTGGAKNCMMRSFIIYTLH
jgi:hypothetical protein